MDAISKMAIRNLHHFGWYESTILDAFDQKKMRIISMAMSVSYHFCLSLLTKTHVGKYLSIGLNKTFTLIPEI